MHFFLYFWLCWVFIAVCGLSLVVTSGGYSLGMVFGPPIAVASLVADHRFQSTQASALVAHGLSCLRACGIFPEQGLNPWQADSYLLDHQGSAHDLFLNVLHSLCHLQKQTFI